MTPAENKQTVEPWAAGFRYWAMADGNPKSTWLITRETARAVVAQADRAAELEAALRDGATVAEQYMDTGRGDLDGWIDRAHTLSDPTAKGPDGYGRPGNRQGADAV